jgi:hypothetical protein
MPLVDSVTTIINTQGRSKSSHVNRVGYTITFSSLSLDQGVVLDTIPLIIHSVSVAGVLNGSRTNLIGNFGSSQTTYASQPGNFLSTVDSEARYHHFHLRADISHCLRATDVSNQIQFQ